MMELSTETVVSDPVNHPSHYLYGKFEVIDILEEAVALAPNPVQGCLQYQVLKYMLRLWGKENSLQDAKKAKWYLNRLIQNMQAETTAEVLSNVLGPK